ncbi:hypothetical protein R3I94_016735 [Phoxinus phoxinus]
MNIKHFFNVETHLTLRSHSGVSRSAQLKIFAKTNEINAWQQYIRTITHCKRKTKQERKRKMSSKKDTIQPDQPKIKEEPVRRESINSGKPNFSDEGRFKVRDKERI